jgi:formate dehydrogenase subunit gamma
MGRFLRISRNSQAEGGLLMNIRIAEGDIAGRVRSIVADLRSLEGPLLPILHEVQDEFGYVPQEALPVIADELNLSRAEVHGVVTFYHDYRDHPAGRHVLKLCRAEACQSMNAEAVAQSVLDHFDLEWGGTTPDGRLIVEATYCLGLCACAPSAMLDGEPIARLTPASVDEISREVGQ